MNAWTFPWRIAAEAVPFSADPAEHPPAIDRRPRAILFDIGLTLIHPSGEVMLTETQAVVPGFAEPPQLLVAALLLAAESRHLPLPVNRTGDEKVALTWGMLLGLTSAQSWRIWQRMMARYDLYCELDPDAHTLLTGLRHQGILVAAVSNSDGTLADELRHFGIAKYFDLVVDSTRAGAEKPEVGIFTATFRALAVQPDECWFVGDGLVNDVLGACRAGVTLAVLYDRFGLQRHLPAVARVERLPHLLTWLAHASIAPQPAATSGIARPSNDPLPGQN